MSSKKKQPAIVVPKPRYNVGQIVFVIIYHKGKPEELLEAEITGRSTWEARREDYFERKYALPPTYSYRVFHKSTAMEYTFGEGSVFPSYFEAAKVFAKPFLKPLK